ncbi:general amidase [Ophiostoma piceae UAMH 11346]|uniref:General amidase n=1 Tax=Ophiostoma piceae (strain UAMH 11346) TaxID=1262450 RepID=S3C8Z6_OPHP1|nr:general amidase [Ophiostoma piceae UAMH 11346]
MSLPLIKSKPLPTGSPKYQALVASINKEFADSVPPSLYIPQSFVDNPPLDVTGIPRACGLLTDAELDITENYDAVALVEAMRTRKLTAEAVATAFAKRAIIAHQVSGCLVEWFMDEAVARAKELDAHLAATGEVVGPLHGLPFSIKEHMPINGHYSLTGFLATRTKDTKDAMVVGILRRLGAVFYCKTAQPQSIMHLESVNPQGRVLNPFNIGLTSGGSTGGEGALIALKGSVLGLGTDIGGSIRCPAGFCGIYGFKPTTLTTPQIGLSNGGSLAEINIRVSAGPMATSLRSLDFFMKTVLAEKPHLIDPQLTPVPWTGLATKLSAPLKIGFMMNDGHIQPQPPITRTLKWAREKLAAAGADKFIIKEFAPFRTAEAMNRIRQEYYPDAAAGIKGLMAACEEPIFPLTQWIIKDAEALGPRSLPEMHAVRMARMLFQSEFAQHWTEQDVDVVVCPVFVGPACEHDTAFYWNYTAFFNYVDYPGAVFPTPQVALAKGAEDYGADVQTPLSPEDEHVRKLWAEGNFEGAPIDLQVVARRSYDNELFGALSAMQDILMKSL